MRKWVTSFVLLVAMVTSVLAGTPMPMHSGEKECPMSGMMDCCEKAQMKSDVPEVRTAQLCCALNCTEPSPTTPSGTFNFTPSVAALESAVLPHFSFPLTLELARSNSPPGLQPPSNPAYIRHLALLI
jgi:hypothetical protein